jgi:hypothetical protein
MSDSPIFDRLVTQFAARGAVYEEFARFTTPEFVWTPRTVVQLDRPSKGVRIKKDRPLAAKVLSSWVHKDVLEANGIVVPECTDENKESGNATSDFGRLIQNYVSQVGESFAERHPLAMVTDMHLEQNNDGSATVVIEGVQPITSVKPLSEREPAEPME